MESFTPVLTRSGVGPATLGDVLVDEYLRFASARLRPNSVTAQAFDLKVFFTVVGKPPLAVTTADVLAFIEQQREPRRGGNVVRLADGEQGLAASTIKRRLATVTSLFDYLIARGLCDRQPVPRSMTPRSRSLRGSPLVRAPKRLPRILAPDEVVALTGALRTQRDRAMVTLMVRAGLRRCEVRASASPTSSPVTSKCSCVKAKVATSGSSRSTRSSSPTCATTCLPNGRKRAWTITCSSFSRAPIGDGR